MAYETKIDTGWSKKTFSIDEESIIFDDTQMMCAEVTAFAYGSTTTYLRGIKTMTDHSFKLIDSSGDEIEFSFMEAPLFNEEEKEMHWHIVNEIWKCFGNRLKAEVVRQLATKRTVTLAKIPIDSRGIVISHNPLLGRRFEAHVPWEELQYKLEEGVITLKSTTVFRAQINVPINEVGGQLLWSLLDSIITDPELLKIIKGMKRI